MDITDNFNTQESTQPAQSVQNNSESGIFVLFLITFYVAARKLTKFERKPSGFRACRTVPFGNTVIGHVCYGIYVGTWRKVKTLTFTINKSRSDNYKIILSDNETVMQSRYRVYIVASKNV